MYMITFKIFEFLPNILSETATEIKWTETEKP